jgi:PAS domain S-box-containing protein
MDKISMKAERIVIALFLAALLAVGSSVYYGYTNYAEGENSATIARRAHRVIDTVYKIQVKILEVKNASDEYVQSHNPYYSKITSQYAANLNSSVQHLLDSSKGNTAILQKANELQTQLASMEKNMPGIDSLHLISSEIIPIRQLEDNNELSANLTSEILFKTNQIVNEATHSLDVWRSSVSTSRRNNIEDTYYTAGAALLFIIIILLGLNNDIKKRRQAEATIRQSEKRLRQVIEEVGDVIYTADHTGRFTFINPRLEALTGYSNIELMGTDTQLLVHPDWQERARKFYLHQFKHRIYETRYEFPIVTKQGETKWVEQNVVMVNHGKIIQSFQCVVRDITQRKNTEEEIGRTNQFLDSILENIPDMIFIKDGKDLRFMRINKAGEKLLGYLQEDMIGKNDYDFFPKEQADFFTNKDKETLKNSKGIDIMEEVINTAHGTRWLHTKKIPVYDAAGVPLYLLGISEDITERKKTEDTIIELNKNLERYVTELKESERFYRAIAHNFPDGTISVLDQNMNYVFIDGLELTLEGLKPEDLLGTPFLNRFPEEIRTGVKNNLTQIFNGGNATFEVPLSGNYYIMHGAPLESSGGTIKEILLVKQNITKLKQAEDNMKAALEKEKLINELKSRFVSLASHEFRTPLSTILSSTELIGEYIEHVGKNPALIKDKNIHHLNRIKLSIQNMVNILNSFLSLDQLEQGKTVTTPITFDVKELSKELIDEVHEKLKSGQKIKYSHSGDTTVYTDRLILGNVMLNLLTNAIKYSPENTIINYTTKTSKNGLEFIIEDHGIGIPETEQANLFERFFRASNTLNIEGTGLGLSIVKKYIDLLDGRISFTSRENEGSIFKVFVSNAKPNATDSTN